MIEPTEVKEAILAAVAAGEVEDLRAIDWDGPTEIWVRFGTWLIFLFIEAAAVYDVYQAKSPDGRKTEFDHDHDPWDLLTPEEEERVDAALGCPATMEDAIVDSKSGGATVTRVTVGGINYPGHFKIVDLGTSLGPLWHACEKCDHTLPDGAMIMIMVQSVDPATTDYPAHWSMLADHLGTTTWVAHGSGRTVVEVKATAWRVVELLNKEGGLKALERVATMLQDERSRGA